MRPIKYTSRPKDGSLISTSCLENTSRPQSTAAVTTSLLEWSLLTCDKATCPDPIHYILFFSWRTHTYHSRLVSFMVSNATFNNISVISWCSVLLLEETGVPGESHRPTVSHWQTLSHNAVSPEWYSNSQR